MYESEHRQLEDFKRRGGYTQQQVKDVQKRILLQFGRDLNEIQVISLMLAWRGASYEIMGAESEFFENYIKEHRW